ncbi:ricin-type beta-trefoil lectin protein [Streptomyces sp. TLI_55]|uniref:RICIN domain-containing protein n=1 Tax=Streptomyces sp. TLI_55 TaxID=1938861 RepID=UPI000BCA35E0|nr:ricin-type beta-trefoil lectin domain protein [Streptomyces sp. TLI_55]SNX62810.1 ricin-type beta-trefoil lectin protein [Streptomyces sp. TLI_55]
MIKHLKYGLAALALAVVPVIANAPASHAADTFRILSRFSDRCLTANGDNVEVAACSSRPISSQDWYWEGAKLVNYAEGKCLDVRNGELDAPAQLVGDCHGQANQRWSWYGEQLRTDVNYQCLSIQDRGSWDPHAGVNLRNCEDTATWQRWYTQG